jgi:hypothetical protein
MAFGEARRLTSVDSEEAVGTYVWPSLTAHGRYFEHTILGVSVAVIRHLQLIRRMAVGNEQLRMIKGRFLEAHSLIGEGFEECH